MNNQIQNSPLPFIFVHIPKTAGVSIWKFLTKKFNYNVNLLSTENNYKNVHCSLFQLETINNLDENTFVFTVCRNPYRRIYSFYCYELKKNFIPNSTTFEKYLENIDNTLFYDLRITHYNQNWWINTKNNYKYKKIYRFEKLYEFENDFQCKLEVYNSSNFNLDLYKKKYTEDCKKRVLDIFYDDFLFFDYDKNWEKSF